MGLDGKDIQDAYLTEVLPVGVQVQHIVSKLSLDPHPRFNSGNRKSSIIVGEPTAQTAWSTDAYADALNFAQTFIGGTVEDWAERIAGMADSHSYGSSQTIATTGRTVPEPNWDELEKQLDNDEIPF